MGKQPGVAGDQLRSFIERIERLHEERASLGEDISEVFKEAKGIGFDTKAMREVLRLRRMDNDARTELEHLVDTYLHAIGDRVGTPRATRVRARNGADDEARP